MGFDWEEVEEHTADCGIRVYADTYEDVLCAAGEAFGVFTTDIENWDVLPKTRELTVEAPDHDIVLHAFLNELIYLLDVEHFVGVDFHDIQIVKDVESYVVSVIVDGDILDPTKHDQRTEIKAVTMHMLGVTELDDGSWFAQVIFDI